MAYETIILERKENIGVIALNRPKQLNALNHQLAGELYDALWEVEKDPAVYVILLTSTQAKAFSAGGDLAEHLRHGKNVLQQRESWGMAARLWLGMASLKKTVIAAVEGYALAGGCALVAGCDMAIAGDTAVFGLPEIKVGIWPMAAAPPLIRCIGLKKFMEFSTTGDSFTAQEAHRLGIVNQVVPAGQAEQAAMNLARKIAGQSQATLRFSKEILKRQLDLPYEQAVLLGRDAIAMLAVTDDALEGMAAFVEKRKPGWGKHA